MCVAAGTRESRSNLPGFKPKNLKRGRPKSSIDTEGISGRKEWLFVKLAKANTEEEIRTVAINSLEHQI